MATSWPSCIILKFERMCIMPRSYGLMQKIMKFLLAVSEELHITDGQTNAHDQFQYSPPVEPRREERMND